LKPVPTAQGRELFATAQLFGGDARGAMDTLAPLADSAGVLYLRAVAQLKEGLRDAAAATFARLVDSSLNADQVAFLKGKALYESGAFEEALASFAAVKTPLPGLALERGKAHVSLRDSAKAEEQLRAAIGETPLDAEANYFLGAILVQQDRGAEGITLLGKSLRARPSFWGTHFYLGRGYLASKKPKEAIAALERARALRPDEAQVDFQLSRAYAEAGRTVDARAALERFRKARESRREAEREALVLR
jgi:tetratricopeptide (TPR) repeat protein